MDDLDQVLAAWKADAIRAVSEQCTPLSDEQRAMVRQQVYFPRYAGEPAVRRDKCRHAVTQARQCDRTPTRRRDGWAVCKAHERSGGFPAHTAIGR